MHRGLGILLRFSETDAHRNDAAHAAYEKKVLDSVPVGAWGQRFVQKMEELATTRFRRSCRYFP
jgi:hypothetical protein